MSECVLNLQPMHWSESSAMMSSAAQGHTETARLLMQRGANIMFKDNVCTHKSRPKLNLISQFALYMEFSIYFVDVSFSDCRTGKHR